MKTMKKFAVAAAMTLLFAGTATAASADSEAVYVPYLFNGEAAYIFGNPSDLLPGSPGASPDTGYVRITNNGASTFTGTIGFNAVSPCNGDNSRHYSVTLAPGDHVSVQINSESSNVGGFNGTFCNDLSTPQLGAQFTMTGTVTLGSASASVDLSIYDKDLNYILQGASPYGQDLGDPTEVGQPTQYFTFKSSQPPVVDGAIIRQQLPADAFTVVAAAPRADVLFNTGYSNETHLSNGSGWYYSPTWSWGFAKARDAVDRGSCDRAAAWTAGDNAGARLCWHTGGGTMNGGWRAGAPHELNNSWNTYRAIYVSNNPTYYPFGPQPNVSQDTLYQGGWQLCYSSVYAESGTYLSDILNACQGDYLLLAGMAGYNSYVAPNVAPSAPYNVSATPGDSQVTVSWSEPVSDGGSPITGYSVTDGNGHSCATTGDTSCTVTGLTNGTAYTFTVTANNANGASAASDAVTATPSGPPPAPTGVTAVAGDGQATVTWTAPASDGGSPITGYTVTASNGATCTTGGELSCTVTGLPNLQWATFTVTATNAAGTGPASEATEAVVPHSADFQVWVPNANIARGSGTAIYVFGATSVPSVRLKVGALNVTISPNESGTAFYQFNPSSNSATRWAVQARAVRGQGKDKVALYASGAVYAPQVVMTKSWAWGSQLTASALKAAPGSNLAMAVNGTEVCRGAADSAGKLACTLDWTPPSAGDYTLTLQYGGADIASRTFTVRAPKR